MNTTIEDRVQLVRQTFGVFDYNIIDHHMRGYFDKGSRLRNPLQAFYLHSTNRNNKNAYSEYGGMRLVYDVKDVSVNLHKFEDKNNTVKTEEVYLSYVACIITGTDKQKDISNLENNIFWSETLRFDSEESAMSYLREKQIIFSKIDRLYVDAATYDKRPKITRKEEWKRFKRVFSSIISPIFDSRYAKYSTEESTKADFERLQKRFRWQNDERRDGYIRWIKEKGVDHRIERKLNSGL